MTKCPLTHHLSTTKIYRKTDPLTVTSYINSSSNIEINNYAEVHDESATKLDRKLSRSFGFADSVSIIIEVSYIWAGSNHRVWISTIPTVIADSNSRRCPLQASLSFERDFLHNFIKCGQGNAKLSPWCLLFFQLALAMRNPLILLYFLVHQLKVISILKSSLSEWCIENVETFIKDSEIY